jgi:hypothetical protein
MHVVSIGELTRDKITYTNKNGVKVSVHIPTKYSVSVYENIKSLNFDTPEFKKAKPVSHVITLKLDNNKIFKDNNTDYRCFITISTLKNPTEGIMAFSNDKDSLINNMGKIYAYGNRLTEYENDKTNKNNITNLNIETKYIKSIQKGESQNRITYIGYGKIVKMNELLKEPSLIEYIPSYIV